MLVPLYFCISLLSAFLLFLVQPMAAKSALPVLGGSPFVWNGCMLFFQSLLLAGYLYAHTMNTWVRLRRQIPIHFTLLVLAVLYFPPAFTGSGGIDPSLHPLPWLLAMLAASIGLPFFIMSATAPMIQRWFSATGHARAENPYFLYAASNLGSFGALLCYPFVVEPNLSIAQQLGVLHGGLALLALLFAITGLRLCSHVGLVSAAVSVPGSENTREAVTTQQILHWLVLALIPSSLLYGLTTYITMDVASVPLFWVVPLAIYLLTFANAFATRPIGARFCQWLHMPLLGIGFIPLITLMLHQEFSLHLVAAHLALFFIVTMSCHARLAAARPPVTHLTQFYLWISLGGVLGGIFNTLLAPMLFTDVVEYPLMLLLSLAVCIPLAEYRHVRLLRHIILPVVVVLGWTLLLYYGLMHIAFLSDYTGIRKRLILSILNLTLDASLVVTGIWILLCYFRKKLVTLFATVTALIVAMNSLYTNIYSFDEKFTARNFFGISRVSWNEYDKVHEFWHGTTTHGIQSTKPELRLKPVSYYAPLIEVFDALDRQTGAMPVGVMGLGVGTIACFGKKGQVFDFFEIDPAVEHIARDDRFFTYLRDCPPTMHVMIGDGRIGLLRTEDARYGLIIADAFTSDAVPVHLLTLEAVRMYFTKLPPSGVLAFNISNRFINLNPVLSAIAGQLDAKAYRLSYYAPAGEDLIYDSEWVILTRDEAFARRLQATNQKWELLPVTDQAYLWRDDFSNIFRVLYEISRWMPVVD